MKTFKFSIGLLAFWLRGEVTIDDTIVTTRVPNTFLGFIPLGTSKENIPLKNISSAKNYSFVDTKGMLLGVLLVIIGLRSIGDDYKYVLLTLFGVIEFLSSIFVIISIEKSGQETLIKLAFYQKKIAFAIIQEITKGLYIDADKTDLSKYMDKK